MQIMYSNHPDQLALVAYSTVALQPSFVCIGFTIPFGSTCSCSLHFHANSCAGKGRRRPVGPLTG